MVVWAPREKEENLKRDVWVIGEYGSKDITDLTKEMLGLAKQYAQLQKGLVYGILMGSSQKKLVTSMSAYGAGRIFIFDDNDLVNYHGDQYLINLEKLARQYNPKFILCAMTANGRDIGVRLAARLKTHFIPGCISVMAKAKDAVTITKMLYGGLSQCTVNLEHPDTIILGIIPEIRGIERPDYIKKATIVNVEIEKPAEEKCLI